MILLVMARSLVMATSKQCDNIIIIENICVAVAPLTVGLDLYVESFANIAEANMVSHMISILICT